MNNKVLSIIMAAGRGSRMKGYAGNKTLLPLIPEDNPFCGTHPIIIHIIENLPDGPKALIVNHKKEDIFEATRHLGLRYCTQATLNGTGGAILAAQSVLEDDFSDNVLITMGDVPFIKPKTYECLIDGLKNHSAVILGFCPKDKKQYGVLEIEDGIVQKITEWKYWKDYPDDRKQILDVCNSGIYAFKRTDLLKYLNELSSKPQAVKKMVDGQWTVFNEFFITDIIQFMHNDELKIGYIIAEDEVETMGVDDIDALIKAQHVFQLIKK